MAVARRSLTPARVAVVPAGPVPAQSTGELVARVAPALRELSPERPELAGRPVERPVMFRGARRRWRPGDRRRSGPGSWSSPTRWPRAHGRRCCRRGRGRVVARTRTTRACQGRPRAVGLNVSIASGWNRSSASSRSRRRTHALGAQRVRDERVGRDREAAGVVDGRDRRRAGSGRGGSGSRCRGQQVAAEGRDLLADDDLDRQAAVRARSSARRGPRRSARGPRWR